MDISKQLDLGNLPEPQRSTILAGLTELVLSRLTNELYEELSSEDQAYLESQDDIEPEALVDFLKQKLPDFDQRLETVASQVKAELAEKTAGVIEVMQHKADGTSVEKS